MPGASKFLVGLVKPHSNKPDRASGVYSAPNHLRVEKKTALSFKNEWRTMHSSTLMIAEVLVKITHVIPKGPPVGTVLVHVP